MHARLLCWLFCWSSSVVDDEGSQISPSRFLTPATPRSLNRPSPPATIRGMDDKPTKRDRGPTLVIAAGLALVPLIYVLSAGPAQGLVLHGYISQDSPACKVLATIYLPLSWLMEDSELFNSLMKWYVGLFA